MTSELKPHWLSQESIEKVLQVSVLDIASALGYNLVRVGKQYQIACPDPKHDENAPTNCYIEPNKNLFKCFSCDIGGNSAIAFYAIHEKGEFSKADFMNYIKKTAALLNIPLFSNDGKQMNNVTGEYKPQYKFVPQKELEARSAVELDRVYRAFLGLCPVRENHYVEWENKRGFSVEQMNTMGLRSVPSPDEWIRILTQLTQQQISLERVPGFAQQFFPSVIELNFDSTCLEAGKFKNEVGNWVYMPATFVKGYFIPVRDENGYIVRLRVRKDEGDPKYIWFSSSNNVENEQDIRKARRHGVSSGAPVSLSVPHQVLINWAPGDDISDMFPTNTLIATEGEIKGQISANVFQTLVAGLPGAGQFEKLIPYLNKWNVNKLIIAYDMDTLQKEDESLKAQKKQAQLFNIIKNFAIEMHKRNINVFLWTWNMQDGKGLDDLVMNRKMPVEINLANGHKRNVTLENFSEL